MAVRAFDRKALSPDNTFSEEERESLLHRKKRLNEKLEVVGRGATKRNAGIRNRVLFL